MSRVQAAVLRDKATSLSTLFAFKGQGNKKEDTEG